MAPKQFSHISPRACASQHLGMVVPNLDGEFLALHSYATDDSRTAELLVISSCKAGLVSG